MVSRATRPLELGHGDLCGPITSPTLAHKRYMFVLIDDCSRYMWTMLLQEKSEAFEKFKKFKVLAEHETKFELRTFRTDRGGEFCSNDFVAYCERNGVNRHLTEPYSPQQNKVVERQNRTLLEMTTSILKHMKVPNLLWGEAVRHSTYLINRISTKTLNGKTPYETLSSKTPNIAHLKVFGCVCYAKTNMIGRKELGDRSRILFHLGTEPGSKAYRLLDPTNKRRVVSRDVVFDESKGWNWTNGESSQDDDGDTFMFEVKERADRRESDEIDRTTQPKIEAETAATDDREDEEDDEGNSDDDQDEQPRLRRSSRVSTKPAYLEDYILLAEAECERLLAVVNDEPWDFTKAKELKVLIAACEDEIFSIEKNNTWEIVDLPMGVKPIG